MAYWAPGLPRPTQICTGSNSPQSATASADEGWPGTSTGFEPNREPSQEKSDSVALATLFFAALGRFLADQRHFARRGLFALDRGRGRGGVGRLGLDARRRDDGGDGEVLVGDRRRGALGQLHLADVERIADIEAGQVDDHFLRNLGRVADQLEVVADGIEHAAALDARR